MKPSPMREEAHDHHRRLGGARVGQPRRRRCRPIQPSADVDRAVERVEEPEPQQRVGDVGHDRRQVGRRAVRADAAEARVQQQREDERARRAGAARRTRRTTSELRERDPEDLVVQSSRKFSSPCQRGDAHEVALGERQPERDRAPGTTTSASEPEQVRREHQRHAPPLGLQRPRISGAASPVSASKR